MPAENSNAANQHTESSCPHAWRVVPLLQAASIVRHAAKQQAGDGADVAGLWLAMNACLKGAQPNQLAHALPHVAVAPLGFCLLRRTRSLRRARLPPAHVLTPGTSLSIDLGLKRRGSGPYVCIYGCAHAPRVTMLVYSSLQMHTCFINALWPRTSALSCSSS